MKSLLSPKMVLFVSVALLFGVLDQATKWWVRDAMALGESREVIDGFFQIVHVQNTGAAFGLLAGYEHAMWLFAAFTVVAVGVLFSLLREQESQARLVPIALGAILAGAVGNAIDRVHKQGVTDFLRFYVDDDRFSAWLIHTFGTNEYPSFNVADVAICVGVGLFLLNEVRLALHRRRNPTPETPPSAAEAAS